MYRNKFAKFTKSKNELNKNADKKILSFKEIKLQTNITIISIFIVVLVTLGSSYAAFVWNNTSTVSQSVATGNYSITIADTSPTTNGTINLASAYPMSDADGKASTPYKFTITNNGSQAISYTLKLNDDTNLISSDGCGSNLIPRNYIRINMSGAKTIGTSDLSSLNNNILDKEILTAGESKTYELRLWIYNSSPNTIIGKHFHGKLEVSSNQLTQRNTTLASAIKSDNVVGYTPETSELPFIETGFFKSNDNDGATYYYRGAVENNYVKIDGLKWTNTDGYHASGEDMLFRIVRINGDGTIRLIADGSIGTSAFNTTYNNEKYVGYTYDNSEPNKQDGTSSTIKTYLDNWYNTNMTSYDKYIANTRFCNDTTVASTSGSKINYSSYNRLYTNEKPSFKCENTTKTYGGEYTLKVGLITADEVAFAGGKFETANTSYYLYGKSSEYWTASPYVFNSVDAYVWIMVNNGSMSNIYVDYEYNVRPVVNLKSDVSISYGIGTSTDPYVLKIN